jgi:ABC-type multidrug transport system ATPase subunit
LSDNVIKIRGLTKRYGKITAVSDLDLNVPSGTIFGFLGPNGAGKTTVIKSILGLTTPTNGEIEVFGKNLYLKKSEILSSIGAVVEAPALFAEFSAFENLKYLTRLSGKISKKKIEETLEIVGLAYTGKQRVGTFSYGMKQRLGIAQALLPENKLIFLDEPTNGLDPHGILGVRNLIRKLSSEFNVSVFLSSHLLSEVEQLCEYVTIIDKGVKICESRVSDLMKAQEQIEIVVAERGDFAKFADKMNLKVIRENKIDHSAHTMFSIEGKEEDIPALTRELTEENIDIYRITKHQNRLEDIFVELTGKNSDPSGSDRF